MSVDAKLKRRWYQDLSVVRWIFVIIGILMMVFAGGCSIAVVWGERMNLDSLLIVGVIGGIPFLVGLLTWWLAAKVGRAPPV